MTGTEHTTDFAGTVLVRIKATEKRFAAGIMTSHDYVIFERVGAKRYETPQPPHACTRAEREGDSPTPYSIDISLIITPTTHAGYSAAAWAVAFSGG